MKINFSIFTVKNISGQKRFFRRPKNCPVNILKEKKLRFLGENCVHTFNFFTTVNNKPKIELKKNLLINSTKFAIKGQ